MAGVSGAVLALAACTGSTEPATDVTPSSATLKARGTADNGRAFSFFEFGPSGVTAAQRQTDRRSWPAGASGTFTEVVGPLYAATAYAFRVCGNDEGKAPVCAQTRSFTTPAAVRDAVRGSWLYAISPHSPNGHVDATAPGPSGTLGFRISSSSPNRFGGNVTCLLVSGRRAAVGAVGDYIDAGSGARRPATGLVTIVDGGPGQQDRVRMVQTFGSTPPSCASAADPVASDATYDDGLVVYDAP